MYQFGIGGMYGRPVGGNLATPSAPQRFGTVQDVNVDLTQKLVALRGQNKGPDDVAPGDMEVKGKGGFGRIEISIYNSLFFSDTITTGVKVVAVDESHPVPANTFAVTVTHAGTFISDLGVFVPATGAQLQPVPSAPVAGVSYTVNASTGVYTFDALDIGKTYNFNYAWTDASNGSTLLVNNHIQGYGPIFELYLLQPYQGNNGMHLFQCRASKMSAPMKRDGYLISDFEFEAFPNAAGQWFEWFQVSV